MCLAMATGHVKTAMRLETFKKRPGRRTMWRPDIEVVEKFKKKLDRGSRHGTNDDYCTRW